MEAQITDPRHKRPLPSGTALARVVAALLREQRTQALRALAHGIVSVPPPGEEWAELLIPLWLRYAEQGIRRRYKPGRKSAKLGPFDVFNARILDYVRGEVFDFLRGFAEATATMLRDALSASLNAGETHLDLQRRLVPIFGQARAVTVGLTESSRAVHGGQMLAAKESGVVSKMRWLASADACPLCLELDGKEVELGQPFTEAGGNPAYSTILHPPRHPRCQCTTIEVL